MRNAYLLNALRKLWNLEEAVKVWRMISLAGVGLCFLGNINASVYTEFPHEHALPHLRKGTVETPIFIQDNAPCYKAKTVLSFLKEEGIAVMKWPPQSSNLNPLESVWKIIRESSGQKFLKILIIYGVI